LQFSKKIRTFAARKLTNLMKEGYLDFDAYIRQGEPDKREKASIWRTAIGLQAVDGLQTSEYLRETAIKHIEGEIDIDEARQLIQAYYQSKTQRETTDDDMQEADQVSANITKILSSNTLDFSAKGYISLHRRIFAGVFKHAGKVRDYDISKKEWILNGDTVHYLNWEDLHRALDYDIEQERRFSYKGLNTDQLIQHITRFVSDIWQIHAFGEGNTRTTAVFAILYLRDLGYKVENDMFAQHSWYFRNALVRANYRNAVEGIDYAPEYLERFFRNLLLGEQWDLRNRYLHIHPTDDWRIQPNLEVKPKTVEKNIETVEKSVKTVEKIIKILSNNPTTTVRELSEMLSLSRRGVEEQIKSLKQKGIIRRIGPDKGGHWQVISPLNPKQ
jgi:fido (protein-threonine AMPylation protein)/biotin operon repressor